MITETEMKEIIQEVKLEKLIVRARRQLYVIIGFATTSGVIVGLILAHAIWRLRP